MLKIKARTTIIIFNISIAAWNAELPFFFNNLQVAYGEKMYVFSDFTAHFFFWKLNVIENITEKELKIKKFRCFYYANQSLSIAI